MVPSEICQEASIQFTETPAFPFQIALAFCVRYKQLLHCRLKHRGNRDSCGRRSCRPRRRSIQLSTEVRLVNGRARYDRRQLVSLEVLHEYRSLLVHHLQYAEERQVRQRGSSIDEKLELLLNLWAHV